MRALKGLLRFDFQLTRLRQCYKKKKTIFNQIKVTVDSDSGSIV